MKKLSLRHLSLLLFLIFMTWRGWQHQMRGGGMNGSPTVDALCPLGGLEGLYPYIVDGIWLQRLAPSALILLIIFIVLTILLGRVFCGWICPMGAITEIFATISSKLGIKKITMPAKFDKSLRWLKYLVLLLVLGTTWEMGMLTFRNYDPWKAWMHLSAGFAEGISALIVLLIVVLAEFKIERFWCRYLCPLGAFFGVFQRISLTKVHRNADSCINCGKCNKSCIMSLKPSTKAIVKDADCISCGACVSACPKANTLEFRTIIKPVGSLSPLKVGIAGLLIVFSLWGVANIAGLWQTRAQANADQSSQLPVYEQMRGWMSLNDIAKLAAISAEELLQITNLPADTDLNTPVRELKIISPENIRMSLRKWAHEGQAKP